jgi:hypothetical protein
LIVVGQPRARLVPPIAYRARHVRLPGPN